MGNKMKKLLCALLASAMLVTSVGVVSFAAPEDTTATEAAETTETVASDDSSTAEMTDEEKEALDAEKESTEVVGTVDTTASTDATAADTTAAGNSYDNDKYYQRALALCSSLGIISGYEDGSVRPESDVTRAEMASIVLRMLALKSTSAYKDIFTDVSSSHWAADQIQSAFEAGVVNGMGDGTYQPDSQVTYAQVVVMLINAMNYKQDAEYYGGWQQGYLKIAGDLGILKNASGSADVAAERGLVIKMVYNTLLADYKEITTYENGQPKYTADKTLAEAKFDVLEDKGMLVGTSKTNIDGDDLGENQIKIQSDDDDIEVGPVFATVLTGLEEYLAQKVTYYYRDILGQEPEVVAVAYDAAKSEVYDVDIDKIDDVTINSGAVSIKLNKVSKAKKTTDDVKVIYNGKLLADVDDATLVKLFQPENGSVKLVKSNKSNDDYDVAFIDSYETVVITSANDDRIIGKMQDPASDDIKVISVTYELDDKVDRTISVIKGGSEARVRNLKKNDVASIKASYSVKSETKSGITYSPEVVDIVVTGESVTGSASSISSKEKNNTTATINGSKYDVANVAADDLKSGSQSVFYLDQFGRIGYIESSSSGRLESGEQYGWIMDQYKGDGSEGQILKIMTQDGKVEEYTYANSVNYWAPNALVGSANADVTKTKAQIETEVANLIANNDFPALWTMTGERIGNGYVWVDPEGNYYRAPNQATRDAHPGIKQYGTTRPQNWVKSDLSVRLVKYKVNSSNKITKLYCTVFAGNFTTNKEYYTEGSAFLATDDGYIDAKWLESSDITALKNSKALIYDPSNKNGSVLVGGLLGGYNLTDDCIEFDVPNELSKYNSASSYTVANVVSSRYNVRENGVGDDYYFADYDGTVPAVLVKFVSDPDSAVVSADFDTTSNAALTFIDNIGTAIDKDENDVFTINGLSAGSAASYTTKTTSTLADVTGIDSDKKKYVTTDVWTAKDGSSLRDKLFKGDLVVTDGNTILRLIAARDLYNNLRDGEAAPSGTWTAGSDSRVKYYFGPVQDADIDDVSWMQVNGQKVSIDAGAAMDIVEINVANGNISKAIDISDDEATVSNLRVAGDDDDTYDIAFVRIAPKGALGEIVIYRITGLSSLAK